MERVDESGYAIYMRVLLNRSPFPFKLAKPFSETHLRVFEDLPRTDSSLLMHVEMQGSRLFAEGDPYIAEIPDNASYRLLKTDTGEILVFCDHAHGIKEV